MHSAEKFDYASSAQSLCGIALKIKQYEIQPNAHVSVWYGEKEPNIKKALQFLTKVYPNAENHPFAGYAHGEIVSHPDVMAEEIRRFIQTVKQ